MATSLDFPSTLAHLIIAWEQVMMKNKEQTTITEELEEVELVCVANPPGVDCEDDGTKPHAIIERES